MDIQKPIDYWKMFADLMQRRAFLTRQRDEAEVELSKTKQLILSIFAMLPEDQRKASQRLIDDMEAESSGLQDVIELVFSAHEGDWLSLSNVRDRLIEIGFDLRRYKANPLASISTTLKRMVKNGFIEAKNSESGTLYRRNAINNIFAARVFGSKPERQ